MHFVWPPQHSARGRETVWRGDVGSPSFARPSFTILVTDGHRPKLPKSLVLRALKRDPQTADVLVIVLTGLGPQNEAKLKKEGAASYFTKSDSLLENNSDALPDLVAGELSKQKTDGVVLRSRLGVTGVVG